MSRVPKLAVGRDLLTEFSESGSGNTAAFAAELNVPQEWVEYWLALAELKRLRQTEIWS
jgi:hypothetical protein